MRKAHDERTAGLRVGEMVQVRSKREILATLDANGTLDALPFMPEMFQYCGRTFRVYKRADKTCDTIRQPVLLRMKNAVHLDNVRCDGGAHGGCQASCLIFWKEAWLTRVDGPPSGGADVHPGRDCGMAADSGPTGGCAEDTVMTAARRHSDDGEAFSCQATELPRATTYLPWWDVRQYVRDVTSGNIGATELIRGLSIVFGNTVLRTLRRMVHALGHAARSSLSTPSPGAHAASAANPGEAMATADGRGSLADLIRNGIDRTLVERPHIRGTLHKTPSTVLNLQRGELVQVRTKEEILQTLDVNNRNRGLLFDVEMVPYCGGTYRVLGRVERILNEATGRMRMLPNPCVILEGVVCRGCFSRNRLFCPRSIYPFWHEVWLKRVEMPVACTTNADLDAMETTIGARR